MHTATILVEAELHLFIVASLSHKEKDKNATRSTRTQNATYRTSHARAHVRTAHRTCKCTAVHRVHSSSHNSQETENKCVPLFTEFTRSSHNKQSCIMRIQPVAPVD